MQTDKDTPKDPSSPHIGFPAIDPKTTASTSSPARTPAPLPIEEETTSNDHQHKLPLLRGFLSFAGFVLSVVLLATLINLFVFQSYYVDGTSMTPTLQPNERLIINKMPKTWANITHSHYIPKRGEIVVFNSSLISPENGQHEQLIKRIIGLPGERVVIKDGVVTIYNDANPNGLKPDELLKLELAATDGDIDLVVPKDSLFVCGDNRAPGGSYDSRSDLGPIASDKMVGELVMRLVPLNKAKLF